MPGKDCLLMNRRMGEFGQTGVSTQGLLSEAIKVEYLWTWNVRMKIGLDVNCFALLYI